MRSILGVPLVLEADRPAWYGGMSEETDRFPEARTGAEVVPFFRADDNPDRNRSPPRKRDWLMCGGQLMEELLRSVFQPMEYLLGIDSALEEGGVLCCELPLLLLQLFDQGSEFGRLLRQGRPFQLGGGMIRAVQPVED